MKHLIPSPEYKAGANTFASFAVDELAVNEQYWIDVFEKWDKPFLVAFGENERTTYRLKRNLKKDYQILLLLKI